MNYWKLYPGDYARDTRHLSLAEHGAYLLLLNTYYATETPLPADFSTIFRLVSASNRNEKRAVESVVKQYFQINGDGLRHNPRADRQINEDAPRIRSARENGKLGGRPKRTKTKNPVGYDPVVDSKPIGLSMGSIWVNPSSTSTTVSNKTNPPVSPPSKPWSPPEGINLEAWVDFEAHRKEIKKPLSDRARNKAANLLLTLTPGQQAECVNHSVIGRYQGLFPEKFRGPKNGSDRQDNSAVARNDRAIERALGTGRTFDAD